ncbi:MAG: FAD-dependent oxidoreductase [Thermodesulfobacteriota bacterium]|nr:FAD-dependent oxidoreductase [Thermodesulfobacteriota bacterium]
MGIKEIIAKIEHVKVETHDVKTFELKPQEPIAFTPGQYFLVSILSDEDLKDEWRPMTFTSLPWDKHITFAAKRMGRITHALHELPVGAQLRLKGPKGESLNFDESIKEDLVFLAGGSGITPCLSIIRYVIAKDLRNKMLLLFSNKSPKDIIYREEFDRLNQEGRITVVYSLSKEIPDDWKGERGRIDGEMIRRHVDRPKDKLWYLCGPPPMTDQLEQDLGRIGVSKERLRMESWELPGKAQRKEARDSE